MLNRLIAVTVIMSICFLVVYINLGNLICSNSLRSKAVKYNTYTVNSGKNYAGIYDCNGNPLNNLVSSEYAVVDPNSSNAVKLIDFTDNQTYFNKKISGNYPFICEISENCPRYKDIYTFTEYERNSSDQLAVHVLGYESDGHGICGIEKGFDNFIRSHCSECSVTYEVTATGNVLKGTDCEIRSGSAVSAGVVTTLDRDIQKICEDAGKNIGKGAIVVMDVNTGEIKAMASFPDFDPTCPEKYIDRTDAPFVNRALTPYSVGSIFKLIPCTAALRSGFDSDFTFNCTGSYDMYGQIFNCHKWGGHGDLSMREAVVESCNTYFIELSSYLSGEKLLETARAYGFGRGSYLCKGVYSSKGNLPTEAELDIPAEKANFSFGQGKLTATPVQIAVMTSAIANGGNAPYPMLVRGTTEDIASYIPEAPEPIYSRACDPKTAEMLRSFMEDTVIKENSAAIPDHCKAGGKTSTAQTGRFDENGNEYLNCWFTGYFPAEAPEYAVTVLVEEGYTGNATAGPVFKEICNKICKLS